MPLARGPVAACHSFRPPAAGKKKLKEKDLAKSKCLRCGRPREEHKQFVAQPPSEVVETTMALTSSPAPAKDDTGKAGKESVSSKDKEKPSSQKPPRLSWGGAFVFGEEDTSFESTDDAEKRQNERNSSFAKEGYPGQVGDLDEALDVDALLDDFSFSDDSDDDSDDSECSSADDDDDDGDADQTSEGAAVPETAASVSEKASRTAATGVKPVAGEDSGGVTASSSSSSSSKRHSHKSKKTVVRSRGDFKSEAERKAREARWSPEKLAAKKARARERRRLAAEAAGGRGSSEKRRIPEDRRKPKGGKEFYTNSYKDGKQGPAAEMRHKV